MRNMNVDSTGGALRRPVVHSGRAIRGAEANRAVRGITPHDRPETDRRGVCRR